LSTSSASLSASSAGRSCSPSDAAERALRTLAVHSTLFRRRADTRASRGQYFGSECARPLFFARQGLQQRVSLRASLRTGAARPPARLASAPPPQPAPSETDVLGHTAFMSQERGTRCTRSASAATACCRRPIDARRGRMGASRDAFAPASRERTQAASAGQANPRREARRAPKGPRNAAEAAPDVCARPARCSLLLARRESRSLLLALRVHATLLATRENDRVDEAARVE
jgi:hypothetical protein